MSDTITGAPSLDGWVLVPREMTDEMVEAACQAADNGFFSGDYLRNILHAVFAAAPPSEALAQALAAAREETEAMAIMLADCVAVLQQVPLNRLAGKVDMMLIAALDAPIQGDVSRAQLAERATAIRDARDAAAREEGRVAGVNEAADWLAPSRARPCDCERCDCGNVGDLAEVAAWDAENDLSRAIRALISPPTPAQTDTTPGGRADG